MTCVSIQSCSAKFISLLRGGLICLIAAVISAADAQEDAGDHDQHVVAATEQDLPEDPVLVVRRQESMLMWMIRSMGPYALVMPVTGLFCFLMTLLIVIRGQGPFAAAALVLIVPIPFWIGIFAFLEGLLMSFQVIATSTTAPKPSEVADGFAAALFTPMLGLAMMTPSYLVALIGALFRSQVSEQRRGQSMQPASRA